MKPNAACAILPDKNQLLYPDPILGGVYKLPAKFPALGFRSYMALLRQDRSGVAKIGGSLKKNLIRTLAVAVLTTLQCAWASVLDTSFNPGTGANGIVEQVLPMPDGRILICGNFTTFNGRNHPYIATLNSDGSLDESFFG